MYEDDYEDFGLDEYGMGFDARQRRLDRILGLERAQSSRESRADVASTEPTPEPEKERKPSDPVARILTKNHFETQRFEYQITFDKFLERRAVSDSGLFTPPGFDDPLFFVRLNPAAPPASISSAAYRTSLLSGRRMLDKSKTSIQLSLHLKHVDSDQRLPAKTNLTVDCKTSIINQDGDKCRNQDSTYKFYETFTEINRRLAIGTSGRDIGDESRSHSILLQIPQDELLKTARMLPDNKLTVHCEFTINWHRNTDNHLMSVPADMLQLAKKSRKTIVEQLKGLWKDISGQSDDSVGDIAFIFGNSHESSTKTSLRAHKSILALRSEFFAAMFTHDTREKTESRVEILDVRREVFQRLLEFVYTGEVAGISELDVEKVEELLITADRYQLELLKQMCESILFSRLSPDTFAHYLVFADTYNAPKLKERAMDYFQKNAKNSIAALFKSNKAEVLLQAFREIAIQAPNFDSQTEEEKEEDKAEKTKKS